MKKNTGVFVLCCVVLGCQAFPFYTNNADNYPAKYEDIRSTFNFSFDVVIHSCGGHHHQHRQQGYLPRQYPVLYPLIAEPNKPETTSTSSTSTSSTSTSSTSIISSTSTETTENTSTEENTTPVSLSNVETSNSTPSSTTSERTLTSSTTVETFPPM